ncbi:MAG: O-antigen ligase family protein [Candidatus Omnitrophica bacterium]|nr:O-antigen ligase family protein [Candidatus Omnitrophota bacterium]
MANLLWAIILGYLFLRPFISEIDFKVLAYFLNGIFVISGSLYLIIKRPIKFTSIDKVILIFLLSLVISTVFSEDISNSAGSLSAYLPLIFLFYVVRTLDQIKIRQLIYVLISSAILVSIYSLCGLYVISNFVSQYLAKNPGYPYAKELLVRKRAYLPFVSPNILANYLVMVSMVSLGAVIQRLKNDKKGLLLFSNLFCLSIGFIALFLTKSMGGWITFVFSIFFFFILGKMVRRNTLIIILLVLAVFALVFGMRMASEEEFTKPTFSVHKRLSYWKETVDIIKEHPLTGIGPGNLILTESRNSHNSYLQILAEMGPLGLISWLAMVFLFIENGLKRLRSKEAVYYGLGILFCGVSFALHNIIDFSFFIPEAAFLWWIVFGIVFTEPVRPLE